MNTLVELLRLPPDHLGAAIILISGFMIAAEYLRISLSPAFPRSPIIQLLVNLLTAVIQPVFLAVVLVISVLAYPERALINVGIVLGMYGVWYLAGQSTLLVRPDSQGADIGFMTIGGLLTFIPGAIAIAVA